MTVDEDFEIPGTGAIFTFGKSRFAENVPSKFWIKNDIISKLACGDEHTAVVTGSGRVFTIGNNSSGQLGLGNRKSVSRPSCVKALKPQRAVQVACGKAHTIVATDDGSVLGWGQNGEGQLGTGYLDDKEFPVEILKLPTPPLQLACGSTHSMLLTDKGQVFVWGSNKEGQLGLEDGCKLTPTLLVLEKKISSISCGYYHSLAVTVDGELLCWGEAEHGKLGLSEDAVSHHSFPQHVITSEKIVAGAAGNDHSLVLTESGNILSCGAGSSGQLGQGVKIMEQHTFQPVAEVSEMRFIYINAGYSHSAAISEDGNVYTWGCGRHGKLCLGERNFSPQFIPVFVSRLRHLIAVQVDCGGCHTMVLGYRRQDSGRKSSTTSILMREAKGITEKMANQLREIKTKQTLVKEIVLPPPTSEITKPDPVQEMEEPEEHHLLYSRFARFWHSFFKRGGRSSYQSAEESKASCETPKLEDLESQTDNAPPEVIQVNQVECTPFKEEIHVTPAAASSVEDKPQDENEEEKNPIADEERIPQENVVGENVSGKSVHVVEQEGKTAVVKSRACALL